jgi:DNA-directed RNA polymerase specialized sigma24 family protein
VAGQRRVDRPPGGGFARLLAALHADPDTAGHAYEHLRRALIRFFECRGVHPPDECADVALERLERKLLEPTPILDLHGYAYGIAKMVMLERLRRPAAVPLREAREPIQPLPTSGELRAERVRGCFDGCVHALSDASRTLVLRYYEADGRARIDRRRQLARELGVSENALRIRIQRLRDQLEACISACLAHGA